MRWLSYSEYKDSGVQWLGQVPRHWEVWKVAHGFHNTGSGTTPPSNEGAWYEGSIPWVTTSELREAVIHDTAKRLTKEALETFSALKLFPKGSLAIAMYGATIGRLGIFGISATTNQACCVMYGERALSTRFMYLWFQAFRDQIILLASGGGQPNISQDKIRSVRVACPDVSEQTAIADFLDRETGRIDTLVAKKWRLITLLKEKRTVLISRTVTRGLPEYAARELGLEPHTRFKDSGIEWLGEVPEGWALKRVKHLAKVKIGITYSPEDVVSEGEGVLVLRASNIQKGKLSFHDNVFVEKDVKSADRVQEGDILICSRNGSAHLVGKSAYITEEHAGHTFGAFMSIVRSSVGLYLYHFFNSEIFKAQSGLFSTSTINQLTTGTLENLVIALPPEEEQKSIASYLDQEMTRIDRLVEKVEAAINRLQEYRTALITAAVTGKIDVREAAA